MEKDIVGMSEAGRGTQRGMLWFRDSSLYSESL